MKAESNSETKSWLKYFLSSEKELFLNFEAIKVYEHEWERINQDEKTLFKNVFSMVENGSKNNPTMQGFGKNGVLSGFDIEKVASYIYHINQEQEPITPAKGGAAPQGTPANWEK